ncbi:MAG: Unknown protein [uncultured Sulfurovum sp.]|uniref:HTH tetR-type domain-containing protein n=1 Tax=uncultured Sulfurovum sp. TaxID=269237 RepID=A0A6S6TY97_9BACT|nr:MAG: Unknown protein [uncultured Sulfurovum sp.]
MKMSSRKKDIIDTSIALFNQEGCLSTSTRHIADNMGISVGNLYYYFKNKEDILVQILQEYTHSLFESLHAFDFANNRQFLFKEFLLQIQILDAKYKFLHTEMHSIIVTFPQFKLSMRSIMNDEVNLMRKLIVHQIEHGYMVELEKNEIEHLIANARILKLSSAGYWNIIEDRPQVNSQMASLSLFYFLHPYLTQKAYDDESWHQLEANLLKEVADVKM